MAPYIENAEKIGIYTIHNQTLIPLEIPGKSKITVTSVNHAKEGKVDMDRVVGEYFPKLNRIENILEQEENLPKDEDILVKFLTIETQDPTGMETTVRTVFFTTKQHEKPYFHNEVIHAFLAAIGSSIDSVVRMDAGSLWRLGDRLALLGQSGGGIKGYEIDPTEAALLREETMNALFIPVEPVST